MASINIIIICKSTDEYDTRSEIRRAEFQKVTNIIYDIGLMSECTWRQTVVGKIVLSTSAALLPDISRALSVNQFSTAKDGYGNTIFRHSPAL